MKPDFQMPVNQGKSIKLWISYDDDVSSLFQLFAAIQMRPVAVLAYMMAFILNIGFCCRTDFLPRKVTMRIVYLYL